MRNCQIMYSYCMGYDNFKKYTDSFCIILVLVLTMASCTSIIMMMMFLNPKPVMCCYEFFVLFQLTLAFSFPLVS